MHKTKLFKITIVSFIGATLLFAFTFFNSGTMVSRFPASVPSNYESLDACEKQEILWDHVQKEPYGVLPPLKSFGIFQLVSLARQEISIKGQTFSDFAPPKWKKYIHARGAVAKIKFVPVNSTYTGIFKGADCGILRLSLTYRVAGSKPVAPGLALKILRDKTYSANISALVSIDGQDEEFDFFKYPMSNIVPAGSETGHKIVHSILKKASKYPEELLAQDMAKFDAHGVPATAVISPRQIFFVPNGNLNFSSDKHDVREDFLKIPEGTVLYQIYALSDKYKDFDYTTYKDENAAAFLKDSVHVADIVTTSKFVASPFGDDGIFFRHQFR